MPEQDQLGDPHRRDRARFVLACAMHGKLKAVDQRTALDVLAFARSRDNPFPGRRVPRVVRTAAQPIDVVRSVSRPREHAPRSRRTRTAPRASRDGPDEPEPGLARPAELTELQQALLLVSSGFEVARGDGRVFASFLETLAIKVAHEQAKRWWEQAA
jgi:hypothetical protein